MLDFQYRQPPNDYPTSDGKPMAETDWHRDQMVELIGTLKLFFRERTDVYVSGNLLWFYQEGDRRRHVSPDVLVRVGAPRGNRLNYLQWQEGGAPQVVFELTSKTTRREDIGRKHTLYEEQGVEEYYLFDPLGDYLKPRFRTFHRHGGRFVAVLGDQVYSAWLDLNLRVHDNKLRLFCPRTDAMLPTPEELGEHAEEQSERADREADRADREADRAEREADRAAREADRAEREAARADLEAERVRALEAELAELRRGR